MSDAKARDIFVISDLHLGDGGMRDNFEAAKKTSPLRAFIDHVGSEDGELFILGDLFELWQMNLSRLLAKRRELLDELANVRLTYVPGNHDVDLAHFIGSDLFRHPFFARMRMPFIRERGGRRFYFSHGHETDPFNSGDDPGFGRMLAIFAGVFEDENRSPFIPSGESVEDVLEQFGDSMLTIWKSALTRARMHTGQKDLSANPHQALTPAQDPDRLAEHVAGVRAALLAKADYDVVVLGHTHKPGRIGDWYFNSGSWTGARNSFLRISSDGHVRYFDWRDGRANELPMPVVVDDSKPEAPRRAAQTPFIAAVSAARTLFAKPKKPERARWLLIVQGLLALCLGVAALTISVGQGSTAGWRLLVTAFGGYAVVDGAISILGAHRDQPVKRLLSRLRGAASLLLGLVVLRRGYVVEIFVVLFGFWAFFSGALRVAAAVLFEAMVDSRWLFLVGVGSMIASVVLLFLPTSAPLLKFVVAGYLCYYGAGELMAGLFGQRLPRLPGTFTSLARSSS